MSDIWTFSDTRIGNVKQALALSNAVCKKTGLSHELKAITPKGFFKYLPNKLIPKSVFACEVENLQPPYPRMIIGCGRIAASASLSIKSKNPQIKLVQILNPEAYVKDYDLLVIPRHDRHTYKNAIYIDGSITDVTPESVAVQGAAFTDRYKKMQKPIIGVLIGGNNKAYIIDDTAMENILSLLQNWLNVGYNIIGSFSRRTPQDLQNKLLAWAESESRVDFWNGTGNNPYFGILHFADAIAVTCDSINMACESIQTGKPTYKIPLTEVRNNNHKFARFHELQMQQGRIKPAENLLDFNWQPVPCDDIRIVAESICKLL